VEDRTGDEDLETGADCARGMMATEELEEEREEKDLRERGSILCLKQHGILPSRSSCWISKKKDILLSQLWTKSKLSTVLNVTLSLVPISRDPVKIVAIIVAFSWVNCFRDRQHTFCS